MAGRSNYRVKVDLSNYHQDARRFSWIYVNSTNVWFISHLKQHIKDVFGIHEPFHLLLNGNEYLPPAEDVRVLNENEIIVVKPGSGINNSNGNASAMSLPSSDMENGFIKDISTTDDAAPYQHKTKCEPHSATQNDNEAPNNVSKADATAYHSILDITEVDSSPQSKPKDDSNDMNFSAIDPHAITSHKRKRVRRKKMSKPAETSLSEIIARQKQTIINKPKIIESYTIPSGKHIRFDNLDDGKHDAIVNGQNNALNENSNARSSSSIPFFKDYKIASLSTLLSLRNCSSPIVFANKKPKYDNGSDMQTENEDTRQSSCVPNDTPSLQSSNSSSVNNIPQIIEEQNKYNNVKPEEYPSLHAVTEIHDVIAFKVLRIGNEYTPEVSNYIVAKTLDWCPKKMLYTFQILKGRNEIEGPSGKFSLPENEAEQHKSDTVEYNFSQLIDPRLIERK